MINIAAEGAERRENAKQAEVQQAVLKKLRAFYNEIYQLEKEIKDLAAKERKLISEGRKIAAGIARWRLERKIKRANKLKSVMPSLRP